MARRRFLVDIGPLRRSEQFRRLYTSYALAGVGIYIVMVAVPYQVYKITGSTLDVGLVSLAELGASVTGAFGGGSLADRLDRRNLLLAAQLVKLSGCALLAVDALFSHPQLWAIFLLASATSLASGADNPARSALFISVVDRADLVPANTLWQVLYQVGAIAGPALGGLVISQAGLASTYVVCAACTTVSFLGLLRVARSGRPESSTTRPGMLEGLRFLRTRPILQGTFLVDLNAMIFGMPSALFPALGLHHFHGGAGTVGLLYAAPGTGALLVASMMGWATNIRRQGRAILLAVALWGAGIVAFGLSDSLVLGFVFLAIAGGADVISAVFRAALLQTETPDELRGRLQGVQTAVVIGGPRLGDFEAGAVSAATGSLEFSVISGGIACILGVIVLARAIPSFSRYRSQPVEEVAQTAPGDEVERADNAPRDA